MKKLNYLDINKEEIYLLNQIIQYINWKYLINKFMPYHYLQKN